VTCRAAPRNRIFILYLPVNENFDYTVKDSGLANTHSRVVRWCELVSLKTGNTVIV
jgi:hypothetical protein